MCKISMLLLGAAILTCSVQANVITYEVDGSFTSGSGTPLVIDGQPWSLSFQIDTTQGQIDFPGQLSFPNTVVHVSVPDLAGTNTGSYLTTVQFSPPGGGMLPPFPELGFNGSLSLGSPAFSFEFEAIFAAFFTPAVWNSDTGNPQFTLGDFHVTGFPFVVDVTPSGGTVTQYATNPLMTATSSVPEPSSFGLTLLAGLLLGQRLARRKAKCATTIEKVSSNEASTLTGSKP
jgi:hypothetical protein